MSAMIDRDRSEKRLSHYRGFVFRWQQWKAPSPDWDHDHCGGCSARFAERPNEWDDTVHTEGWVTLCPTLGDGESEFIQQVQREGYRLVPSPKLAGFQLDWLCPECFEACRERLEFVVDPDHPQWKQAGM